MGVDGQCDTPLALPPTPDTHHTGGWLGPRAAWTGAENLAPTRI